MKHIPTYKYRVTVFTPTYNRAYILPELYESLQNQTVFDFEWLIVDDGSSDDTETLVRKWLRSDNKFNIRYYKKENGGKHRAINYAVPIAQGELFFIVDSDDHLTFDAIETIISMRGTLPAEEEAKFAGVCGCRGISTSEIIGTTFQGDILDCSSIKRTEYGIDGDKAEAFFTYVLAQYPFPEFEGEKFVTECAVWDRIALDGYLLRYFNQVVYICHYREDGLTQQGLDLYYRNPQGYGYYLRLVRDTGKMTKGLEEYFAVQCLLNWYPKKSVKTIAELIGVQRWRLLCMTALFVLKEWGSKVKRILLPRKDKM